MTSPTGRLRANPRADKNRPTPRLSGGKHQKIFDFTNLYTIPQLGLLIAVGSVSVENFWLKSGGVSDETPVGSICSFG